MDLIKRIGTLKRKFKLQFYIGRLKFSAFCPGKIYIVIRRGNHKKKSQQKLQMSQDYKLNFKKQILELEVTLFFDQNQKKYQQKFGEINIVVLDSKQGKYLLGVVPFDVAQFANCGQQWIKQKKDIEQMPKKLQGLIQFNVFIKYIGQGSESSLDKISDFFFGKTKQPQVQQKVKTGLDGPGTYLTKKNGSDQENRLSNQQNKMSKTEVKIHKTGQSNKASYATAGKLFKSGKQINTKDLNTSQNFYFDEPTVKSQHKLGKKKPRSNSMKKINYQDEDSQKVNGKMTKTNYGQKQIPKVQNQEEQKNKKLNKNKQNLPDIQSNQNKQNQKSIQMLQLQLDFEIQQKKSYKQRLSDSQNIIKKLQKDLHQTKNQNQSLKTQIQDLNQQLKSMQQQNGAKSIKSNQKIETSSDSSMKQKFESLKQELKKLQKQKNELIVENSKLKEKYKQDLKKYEQALSQKDLKNNDLNETGKLQLLRMKEQCVKYRQSIEKLTKQKNEKALELNRQRLQNKKLNEQMAGYKNTLSQIKIKIADKLNEAIVTNDQTLINMLMEINKEG